MKVLIIRLSSIGDIVLTSPVIRCLKKQLPDVQLHYLTKKAYTSILRANPYIDKVIFFEDNLRESKQILQKENYDEIIDLHHNLRTFLIKLGLRARKTSFNKLNIEKWLMVNFKWNKLPGVHIVDRYLKAVEHLGVFNDGEGLDYFIPPEDEVKLDMLPKPHREGYIAVSIGGKFETKKLPVDQLVALCKSIDRPVILLGGKEDAGNARAIESGAGNHVYSGCGKFSINQSASIIHQAGAVVTHDTGMMHIAAAFNKKILSIWGNTIPEFGMYPYVIHKRGGESIIFQINDLGCRPCSKIGFDRCPKGHFKCMREIEMQEVAQALVQ